jgi:hypothetical protein
VKPEKKLYHLFKKNCPDLLITPLEVWNNLGVPDLLLYNKNVGFFMVESAPRPSFLYKTLWIGKYKRLIGKP